MRPLALTTAVAIAVFVGLPWAIVAGINLTLGRSAFEPGELEVLAVIVGALVVAAIIDAVRQR